MPAMHMMIGNVGSGKSEMAAHMAKKWNAVICNMDAIQESMHGFYGGYSIDMKPVYQKVEESLVEGALSRGVPVIIDRTNLDKKRRERFIEIAKKYTDEIHAYHFPVRDSAFAPLLSRRMKNPRGLPQKQWESVIQKLADSYEAPTHDEGIKTMHDFYSMQIRHTFLAVDFDGTIVGNNFPEIGAPINAVIQHMRDFWEQSLFHRIIIWSCRGGDYIAEMAEFLRKYKIPYDFINENPIMDYGSRKVFANEYLDDRNIKIQEIDFGGI